MLAELLGIGGYVEVELRAHAARHLSVEEWER